MTTFKNQDSEGMTKRCITFSRAWARMVKEDPDLNGVTFENGWVSGAYIVRVNGHTIAQTADKWMADMIFSEATKGRS